MAPTLTSLSLLGLLLAAIPNLGALAQDDFKCGNDRDCSLNGICDRITGLCSCDPGWRDLDCGVLDTLPVTKGTGYNKTGEGTSSWGSKMIQDPKDPNTFYLFAAEFEHGCGLDYWAPYSHTIRAVSKSGPLGPYDFDFEVVPAFSHNPTVIWSPADQLWLLYMIGCSQELPDGCVGSLSFICDSAGAANGESGIFAYSSPDLENWTYFGLVYGYEDDEFGILGDHDVTNPSVFPFYSSCNQTAEIMLGYRYNDCHEYISVATAPRWNATYTRIPDHPLWEYWAEDPHIWRDRRGHWHIIMHSIGPQDGSGSGPPVGRHGCTDDIFGIWTWGKRSPAYNTTVFFTDGTSITYGRRERPQLYFSDDGNMTPLFMTNAVQEQGTGQSYSIVNPIGAASQVYIKSLGF